MKKLGCLMLSLLSITTTGSSSSEVTFVQRMNTASLRLIEEQSVASTSITGVWDFELSVNRMVGHDGFIRKESRSFEWVIRFKQEGEKLTGDLIGGRGSRGEGVCADAAIEGSVKRERVSFVVTYQGSCCYQEQMKFTGEAGEEGKSLTGNLEPVGVPRTFCDLAYASIIATKR